MVDLVLRNIRLYRTKINRGLQLENIEYLKLINDGYDIFFEKYDKYEIDSVCYKEKEIKHSIFR